MNRSLERLKIRLVLWWFRLTGKLKPAEQLLTIRREGSGVKSALIILPRGDDDFRVARHFLKSLKPDGRIDLHILVDSGFYHSITELPPASVETYSLGDVGWFMLPKKELSERVLSNRYHAVVDMHPYFNLSTAYLTYLSRAPLRVGFSSRYSERFFNIEIERKSNYFVEQSYLSIQKLLNL